MPEDKGMTRSEREEKVLQFWKENKIFEKSLEKPSPKGEFVFYEGPPTANGKPGIHHLESRAFKDAVPRYKTMQGFKVPRKAGWDTHGLPVEIESEKKLGLKSKREIEEFGVALFNAECRRSVLSYIDLWSKFTERIGYWVSFDDAYFTFDNSYIESVWSIIAEVEKKKLLYKDYKVVPWCPRCGTGLSSHELAQGYSDVKDLSIYAKFKIVGFDKAYFVAWTTTPWTLPGNLALAVGKDITYVEAKVGEEILVLAKDRLSVLTESYEIIAEHKGNEMVGMEYEPLYPFIKEKGGEEMDKAFKVYTADFVTTEDGTGIVHTAVMYGQEDFDLGTKVGLPKIHLVSPDATFVKGTGWLEGRSVVDETLAVDILKDLQARGLVYKKESYLHSYPFCWRCKTKLIYYARDSWYIRMSSLRGELLKENEKINWEPDYIKNGRFGEWLREVKDWAISRERYWGTPLPVWLSESGERIVIDSVDTFRKYTKKSGNSYFVMRHGGSQGNERDLVSYKLQSSDHLTEAGKKQATDSGQKLKKEKIDLIISSPFTRTKETAEIARGELGLSEDKIIFDERLREINPGDYDGKNWDEYHRHVYNVGANWFNESIAGGESLADVCKRVGECLYEIEEKYKGKNILIVTHGGPAWLSFVISGYYDPRNKKYHIPNTHIFIKEFKRFDNAEVRELPFAPLPHNETYQVDLHKPYIDEIVLEKDGIEYKRTKEVMDVWLDSGTMPIASYAGTGEEHYPADFISEAIDQTRGWFYTLHAVGVLLGKGAAFKNVICLGHILDKEGKKMSKSVGNVIEPFSAIEKYGVDVLRLWMYSVNQPGEPKNFDEKSVEEVNKRIFNLLDNVYSFYELYRDREIEKINNKKESKNILDKWILTKLDALVLEMTKNIDEYRLLEPVRNMRDFIDDLSTWYLRRSRDRVKLGDVEAKQTLYHILKNLSKLLAPFAPFAAEELYQKLRIEGDKESVHLEVWPEVKKKFSLFGSGDKNIVEDMEEVRRVVSLALEARSKANIKIRQPLQELRIKNNELGSEYLELVKDEINVKSVVADKNLVEEILLDTKLTPELEEEGKVREIMRNIQEMRKEKNLKPSDRMDYKVIEDIELYKKHSELIERTTNSTLSF